MDYFDYRDGVLFAEDVPLPELAEAVGTPFYCYSTATIERHFTVFSEALAGVGTEPPLIAYAVKANPNKSVIATLARMGAGADVVSSGELRRAMAGGVPAGRIVFSGVGKTREELAEALSLGIFQFNLESEPEAEMLSEVAVELGKTAPVSFRVNPDVDAGTHRKISTGKAENKFGVPISRAMQAYALAASLPGLDPLGVAVHIGSQLTQLAPMEAAFARVGELIAELRAAGHDIRRADLGGGLGIPYDRSKAEPPLPSAYGEMVARVTRDWGVRLTFEPGRLIVGNAGVLVSRVIRVKRGESASFVIVDAAMNDLIRPTLYEAWHDILAVEPREGRVAATIVGPVCETGDTFAEDRAISPVAAGDLVAFMTSGAYGATMASTYNSRPLVPEVIISKEKWAIVRPRPPIESMIDADTLAPWLDTKG
jgi:diaminopimelate decarboxylase